MEYNINRVVSQYFPLDDFTFTYNLPSTTTLEHVGRALTFDPSADNQFKPAGDGDAIHGRLFSFEDRRQQAAGVVGAVERKFKAKLPVAEGQVVNRGDTVVGAGDGFVKSAAAADHSINIVTEVFDGFVTVEYL